MSKQKKERKKVAKKEIFDILKHGWEGFKNWVKAYNSNIFFVILNVIFLIAIIGSIAFSIYYKWCNFDDGMSNAVGILSQVITAIVSFVTSIIGISISLQTNVCLGIPFKDFSKLRVGLHYPIAVFVTLSISLTALNVGLYVADMLVASITVAVVAVLFCIYVVWTEIPLMVNNDKYLIKVIKNRLWREWKTPNDLPKELKAVLKYLLTEGSNLSDTFTKLKTKDAQFNKYLLINLLQLQCDVASKLNEIESKERQLVLSGSLYKNILDIISYDFDIEKILGSDFNEYYFYVTRVLFQLKDLPEYKEKVTSLIANRLMVLRRNSPKDDKVRFIMSIILAMTTISIRDGDFCFAKALQEKFSISHYDLGNDNYASIVFALISLQLYFLCNDSQNATDQLKEEIEKFLNFEGIVHHTEINSWKKLFVVFSRRFKINFAEFMCYFSLSEKDWDVPLYFKMQWIPLDKEYAFLWYFTNLLNSRSIYNFDFNTLCIEDCYKHYLKNIGDECYSTDKVFIESEKMKKILRFYHKDKSVLYILKNSEDESRRLFEFINNLKIEDLKEGSAKADRVSNNDLLNTYKQAVIDAITNEWGFNPCLKINSESKTMNVLIERVSLAINYEEVMKEMLIRSIFNEIKSHVPKLEIKRSDFNKSLGEVLNFDIDAISELARDAEYYIDSAELKEEYRNICGSVNEFSSGVLDGYFLVCKNGFAFNLEFVDFNVSDLSDEDISNEVENCKREDGQYVYEGVFLSREEIARFISKQFALLTITIKYEIQTFENSVIELVLI
ncbi:MAG: hypothetical protein ACI4MQ_03120 [Candidatus Coproplasma sp.]